ncbi:hypothetical protein V1281_006450 [Nitrobacteraceae bacterium AZCC 2161]
MRDLGGVRGLAVEGQHAAFGGDRDRLDAQMSNRGSARVSDATGSEPVRAVSNRWVRISAR